MTRKLWLTLVILTAAHGPWAGAQDQLRDFTRPILVLNTGGHHAPIRSLIFTPDGGQLLSAGLDKVINVWGVQGARPLLEATIRPPIWRGAAGEIHALALAPELDQRGQRVLAVAGFGVGNRRGNIGLFYLPVASAIGTGEHFAELVKDDPTDKGTPDDPRPSGHSDVVTCLAFDPKGTYLASGSVDATARIWDWRNRRTTATLRGHVGAINALAFAPDGTHLLTGGRDGTLRLWDITRPAAPTATASYPPLNPNDPLSVQINALAVSDDGNWVVVGREDGRGIRYDAKTLLNGTPVVPGGETIEALALSHDGKRLVTSSIRRLDNAAELPRLSCSIKVRRFPDGALLRELPPFDSIAYACRFSPDDKLLAIAGGDMQTIRLIADWDAPAPTTASVKGLGRSIWDVGLRDDGGRLAVGYSQDPNQNLMYAPRDQAVRPRYFGMILPAREITSYDPADLSRGLIAYAGWRVVPVGAFQLDVVHAAAPQRTFRITLDEVKDRRWKSYSFIPPGPEHAQATLAVGCEAGVWFYRLNDGRATRLYAGHSGPVYCMAPSKDGRWLATGSSDQTVRLWTLAGCDTPPTLGASFERGPEGLRVGSVEPLGFADAMGMKKGDVPIKFGLARKIVDADEFLAHYEEQLPNSPIELIVRRKVEPAPGQVQGQAPAPAPAPPAVAEEVVDLYTSRRNSPALSLFVAEDREWVLWMPRGYYDTSIAGDTKFLGWHMNRGTLFEPKPSDYLEIIKFEKQLRQLRRHQPNKLDTLLTTADLALALSIPFPPPLRMDPAPPRPVDPRIVFPPLIVAAAGAPARPPLPQVVVPAPAAPGVVPGVAAEARPPGPLALGPVAPLPAAPAPEAGIAAVPAPAVPTRPIQQVAQADAAPNRLIPRPGAPAAPEVKAPVTPPLGAVVQVPDPRPRPATPPATRSPARTLAQAGDDPRPPQPEPAPAPAAPPAEPTAVAQVPALPKSAEPRITARPRPVTVGNVPVAGNVTLPPAPIQPGAAPVATPPRPPVVLGPAAPPPAAPADEVAGGAIPAPERLVPPARQLAGASAVPNRLVPRPGAPAATAIKPPSAPPLVGAVPTPTPQPQPANSPAVRPPGSTPALAAAGPDRPQPEPATITAAPPAAPVTVAGTANPLPTIQERPLQAGRPQQAPLGINAPRAQPLGPVAAPIPAAPAPAVQPLAAPGQQIAMQAPILPPPLDPAEFVEQAAPPLLEARIQPLRNQRITTLEGKPIDPREAPPDKIAIGDLDADGKGTLQLDLTIDADGRSPARSFDFRVDGRPIRPITTFDPPIVLRHEAVKLSLAPGPHRITAEVENLQGIKRTVSRDIFVRGVPQHRPTRLKLLTIAPTYQQTRIPVIEFAERDARDLRRFFLRYLVSPEDEKPLLSVDEDVLEGPSATAERVRKSIDALKNESLGEGDLVVVVIESHFLHIGSERSLVAADGMKIPPSPGIPADELAYSLGALALHGCKVIVLLDSVHTASSPIWDTDVSDWVRNLRDEQNVITFVASNSGPSKSLSTPGHRAFAQAVLDSVTPPLLKESAYLLNDFRDVVVEQVLKLTERQQQAACYLPESINGQFPLLNPQAAGR